jgi:DNA-binding CsgD family transcriptional regulator
LPNASLFDGVIKGQDIMLDTLEHFIDVSNKVNSESRLRSLFVGALRDEGYENAVFARVSNRRLISVPWSDFPSGYLDAYQGENWDKIDPVVQRIRGARGPFRWSETYSRNGFTRTQRNFFEQCKELGVHSGITIPMHGPGQEVDLVSVSMRSSSARAGDRASHVYLMSVQYWLKYCELVDQRTNFEGCLTRQELECVRWCKEGKTNWEIGEIMRISEKTVEFHLTNAMRKLGATNRMTAVITAIKAGLVAL